MSFKKTVQMMATLSLLSSLVACNGGGFQTLGSATGLNSGQSETGSNNDSQTGGGSGGNNGGTTTPPSQPTAYDKLNLDGYVYNGVYEGNWVMGIDKPNNAMIINLPIPAGPFPNITTDLPGLKGAKIKTYYDSATNRAQVAVSVPLQYVLHGVTGLSVAALPNGTALPRFPSTQAPSLAFSLNANSENRVYLYIGVNAVALYIENSYIPAEYQTQFYFVKNSAQTQTLGNFAIIPKSGNFNGGLYTTFQLANDVVTIIDAHLSGLTH